jgi:hypothetical protein
LEARSVVPIGKEKENIDKPAVIPISMFSEQVLQVPVLPHNSVS